MNSRSWILGVGCACLLLAATGSGVSAQPDTPYSWATANCVQPDCETEPPRECSTPTAAAWAVYWYCEGDNCATASLYVLNDECCEGCLTTTASFVLRQLVFSVPFFLPSSFLDPGVSAFPRAIRCSELGVGIARRRSGCRESGGVGSGGPGVGGGKTRPIVSF
jgi:hypothetical protein